MKSGLTLAQRASPRTTSIMPSRLFLCALVAVAMVAFAANSLLCRAALKATAIDPASFTLIRLAAGALVLLLITWLRQRKSVPEGSWLSAIALFVYAAAFSLAYVHLPAAVGALVLFGAVQVSMIGYGLWVGEKLRPAQVAGLAFAIAGLVMLLAPGLAAPPPLSAALMVAAGIAWGCYSLRGRRFRDPTEATAGNFLRAVPFGLGLAVIMAGQLNLDPLGILYAVISGAITSGLGYAIWYAALPKLPASSAAVVQLSVPVIAALGGVTFLGEVMTLRLILSSLGIIGGIALVVSNRAR
jgi:drug/metabolite transporter (DMT)-like permease